MNLDAFFRETAAQQPDQPGILAAGGVALSYRELDSAIGSVAKQLEQAGVRQGACVGLHVASGWEYIVFNYAIWRCGGCVVPIPTELAAEEKHTIFRQIAIDFVVSLQNQTDLGPIVSGDGVAIWRDAVVAPARWFREHPRQFDKTNPAFIRFTSGTTGASKGVVLSHETIRDRTHAANEALRLDRNDRVVWLLPMSYHFAVSIVSYLSFGCTIILPENYFGSAVAEAIHNHAATVIYASPMHYSLLAENASGDALASLRLALSTTSSLDPATAARFLQRCGRPVGQALGIIEIGLPCINLEFAAEKPESVGKPLPAYELKLEEAGLGQNLGNIAFRGKGFLDAYYDPWRSREELMPDGWFRTGDVGELDADGCLYLRGRSSDVINVMGMKFFPQEVEAVLLSHPQVAEACVFARSHDRLGEVPCASVRPRATAVASLPDELRQFCGKHLAAYKVPLQIDLVASLPKTASGKLLHRMMASGPGA